MAPRRFDGKVALVTGGNSGIGRETSLAFAREGAAVVVTDVTESDDGTVGAIRAGGGTATFVRCDVSSAADVERTVAETVRAYGRLDCAFNNAGIGGTQAPLGDYPDADWQRVIAVNLIGVMLGLKHQIRQMLKQGGGAIVNNASILGVVGFANASAYVAAKHGVLGLTKTVALEYATQNVRVNAVCPGFIETPMLVNAGITAQTEMGRAVANLHPMKRFGQPREIAAAVLWLCSDEASFVTGHPLLVDGGYVAQ